MNLLEVKDLNVRFEGLTAVSDLNFTVNKGEVVSIIGPNGAGKTTVFNAVTGVRPADSGRVLIEGKESLGVLAPKTYPLITLAALGSAVAAPAILNIQTIWNAAITANYSYNQSFSWGSALLSLKSAIVSLHIFDALVLPVLIFAVFFLAGTILINRARRSPEAIASLGIARTFQNIRLFKDMTAAENVICGMDRFLKAGFVPSVFRLPSYREEEERARTEAAELLKFVGLESSENVKASSLPYGCQRRLEIARALAQKPKLLLLDEPAAGMNPSEIGELISLIARLKESGVTILLIEHHMNVVMGISDRIVVIDYGNKIAEGSPSEVRNNPGVIEAYLGKKEDTR